MSVAEALGSPPYRRVSIAGRVTSANLSSGPTFKRRDVAISDGTGTQTITAKMWSNDPSTLPIDLTVGNEVQLTNLTVEHYRTRVTHKSNDDTEMTITNDGGPQTVQVIAYNFNGMTVKLITESRHLYHISPEMLTSHAENIVFPLTATGVHGEIVATEPNILKKKPATTDSECEGIA